jgi:hypothetical protein
MLKRFHKYIGQGYILDYDIPNSFFDEHILKYLDDKCCREIAEYNKEIDIDSKALVNGGDKAYHKIRRYFYKQFKLKPAEQELKRIRSKYEFKFGKKKTQNKIDIDAIKEEVKCWDLLGKPEREDGNRLWYKLRNERTASCCVYKETNSFFDFGSGTGGSIIDLFMLLNKCDAKEAIRELNKNIC